MQKGFVTGYQSMDTDIDAYELTKQAFYDGRILAPKHLKALKELLVWSSTRRSRRSTTRRMGRRTWPTPWPAWSSA